jgi:hypothetical protein
MGNMERIVASLNIKCLHRQLRTETDKTKRRMLVRLLSEAQANLAAFSKNSAGRTDVRLSFSEAMHVQI